MNTERANGHLEKKLVAQSVSTKEEGREIGAAGVTKSAGIVSIAVMFSRIFGVIREMVFSRFFGAGYLYDAYQAAFTIPNLLRDLFAEGALSVAFVKVFTDYQVKLGEKEAWRLAALVFNLLAVTLSAIVVLGILLAPYFVPIITWGFSPEKARLATTLTQVMFPFILFVALAAVTMGVLNTKGNFAIPASASTAFNIVSIISGLALAYYLSAGGWEKPIKEDSIPEMSAQWAIIGMAIGTLVGGVAQIGVQLPSLFKVGFRFKPLLSFTNKGVRRVMRLMGQAVIGTSAVQIKVLFDLLIVSSIDGGRSWLSYSFRLMQFPIGVFGVAIGVASLPALARLGSKNNIAKFRSMLSNSLGLVFLMTIPSACGLLVLGEPIVRLIYQGGSFDSFDTDMVRWSLAAYSLGLAGYAAIKVLAPSFYALEDAKTPMYVSIASIIVHIFFSYTMTAYFSTIGVSPERPNGYGHIGVALSTSIIATASFLVLAFLMRRKIKRIEAGKITSSFIKILIASIMMSAFCYFSYRYLTNYFDEKTLFVKLVEAIAPISVGGISFFIIAKILGVHEINTLTDLFLKKLK